MKELSITIQHDTSSQHISSSTEDLRQTWTQHIDTNIRASSEQIDIQKVSNGVLMKWNEMKYLFVVSYVRDEKESILSR